MIMNNDIKKLQVKFILGVIIIVFAYVIFTIFSDVEKIQDIFSTTMIYDYFVPIIILFSISLILRSFIQKNILKQLGIHLTFKQSFFLFFAGLSMLITPLGIGQTIKSHFLNKHYGIPYSKSFPLVLAERFYDFISIIILLLITIILTVRNESIIVISFSTLLLFCILFFTKKKSINILLKQKISSISFLKQRLENYDVMTDSVSKITKSKNITKILPLVFIAIIIESIVIYLGFLTFKIDLNYFESIQIFYSSLLLGIFSFLPGGVGVTEASFIKLITNEGLSVPLASSLILFLRFVTIWSVSIVGFIFAFSFFKKKK